jgi:MoaA/NifB/PqqE/SkfB family radical SAM enzyme
MKPEFDNTFCYYPFIQLALKQWDFSYGIKNATPCCNCIRPENQDPMNIQKDLNESNLTIDEIFHHPSFKEIRKNMLEGKKPKACEICYKSEELYGTSYRIQSEYSIDKKLVDLNNPNLEIIDIDTGESCNLRCRMCHPDTSNQLRIDLKKFKERNFDYSENQPGWWKSDIKSVNKSYYSPNHKSPQWQDLKRHLVTITSIKASGGETLMSRAFLDLLDYAIDNDYAKNISLNFHTNATKFNKKMIERFKYFKNISPDISIDGVGKTYEYIRFPEKFSTIEKNIEQLLTSEINCNLIRFNYVLTSYNIYNIEETIEWVTSIHKKFNKSIKLHVDLVFPEGRNIDIKWLPNFILEEVLQNLEKYENHDNLYPLAFNIKKSLNYMRKNLIHNKDNHLKLKLFKEETVQFDLNRNQKYHDYCHPTLVKLLDSI